MPAINYEKIHGISWQEAKTQKKKLTKLGKVMNLVNKKLRKNRITRDKYLLKYLKAKMRYTAGRNYIKKKKVSNRFFRSFRPGYGELDKWGKDKRVYDYLEMSLLKGEKIKKNIIAKERGEQIEDFIEWPSRKRPEKDLETEAEPISKIEYFFNFGKMFWKKQDFGWKWIHLTRSEYTLRILAKSGVGEGYRTLKACMHRIKEENAGWLKNYWKHRRFHQKIKWEEIAWLSR